MTRAGRVALWAFALAVLVSAALCQASPVTSGIRRAERINVLLLGCDEVDFAKHTDTMIVASYDPVRKALTLVSIPRDTRVVVPGLRVRRINEVFAATFHLSHSIVAASSATARVVGELLGIELPYFVQVDYAGFRRVIDLLGGVDVHVSRPMDYDDNWGRLHIHFAPGEYRLDGSRSLEYLRFRDESGDLGRIERQQGYLRALLAKAGSPRALLALPALGEVVARNVTTNLSAWDVMALLYEAKELDRRSLDFVSLSGSPRRDGTWSVDQAALDRLRTILRGQPVTLETGRITVEVWNASGRARQALGARRLLLNGKVDVVKWGNYSTTEPLTRVINRSGDLARARRVADLLGCPNVTTKLDESLMTDVTVILGEDFGARR